MIENLKKLVLSKSLNKMSLSLFTGILISLNPNDWTLLSYDGIPKNELAKEDGAMILKINHSASPLIYPLKEKIKIKGFRIHADVSKLIQIKEKGLQGKKGFDDFQLRMGLVLAGDNKMNAFQAMWAPDWVEKLFSLGKKYNGIDHIHFYNLANQDLKWQKRTHPLSKWIKETIIGKIPKDKKIQLEHYFNENLEVIALWFASDGDDLKVSYDLKIKKIELFPTSNEETSKKAVLLN